MEVKLKEILFQPCYHNGAYMDDVEVERSEYVYRTHWDAVREINLLGYEIKEKGFQKYPRQPSNINECGNYRFYKEEVDTEKEFDNRSFAFIEMVKFAKLKE